jgi:hypothetical protein
MTTNETEPVKIAIAVPIQGLPNDERRAMKLVQAPFLLPTTPNDVMDKYLSLTEYSYQIVFHWVFKLKWASKHRIPGKRKVAEGWKPLGEVMAALLGLCERCYAIKGSKLPYRNAYEWWAAIVLESKYAGVVSALSSPGGKDSLTKAMWQEVGKLRAYENPYDPGKEPHIFALMAIAVDLAQKRKQPGADLDVFRKECWKPLLDASTKWINTLRDNEEFKAFAIDGDKLRMQGRGKHKPTLSVIVNR